jgi:5-methylcytosine-specific restriction endonuclease McrA
MPCKTKEDQRKYQREWILKRRSAWLKANGPCVRCGSWENLEVDHIDPKEKKFNPAGVWSRKREAREEELNKCQVLCEGCHKNKTLEDQGGYTHGVNNYNRGCRCDVCTQDKLHHNRLYRQRTRDRVPR